MELWIAKTNKCKSDDAAANASGTELYFAQSLSGKRPKKGRGRRIDNLVQPPRVEMVLPRLWNLSATASLHKLLFRKQAAIADHQGFDLRVATLKTPN
jgi:hypothetical protein